MNDHNTGNAFRARLRRILGAGAGAMAFDAFISYSHAADGRLAPALQRAIQRLAKPWYRARALRVFRDESALSANPHLWSSIQAAMDDAGWFVLLASPDAVASQWVNRELDHWLSNKSADRILVVLTDGTLDWDGRSLSGSAVPAALRDAFADEPRHVDLRWAATETDLDMHHARFRDVVAQLAAPMHGVAKDDLDSEDVRQHRRARRLARGGVAVLTLLVVVSLIATGFALVQRHSAQESATRATQQQFAALTRGISEAAISSVQNHRFDVALLLAVQSARFAADSHQSNVERERARRTLIHVLADEPPLSAVLNGLRGPAQALAFSSDGSLLAASSLSGDLRVWDTKTRRPLPRQPRPDGLSRELALDAHGILATLNDQTRSVRLWNLRTNAPWKWQPPYTPFTNSPHIALSNAGVLAFCEGTLDLWDVNTGRRIGTPIQTGGPNGEPVFSVDGRSLAIPTTGGSIVLVDPATGTVRRTIITGAPAGLLRFSADGREIADTQSDPIRRWNTATGEPAKPRPRAGIGPVLAVDRSGAVSVVDTRSGQSFYHLAPDAWAGIGPVIDPGGGLLAVSQATGTVLLTNLRETSSPFVQHVALPRFVLRYPPGTPLGARTASQVSPSGRVAVFTTTAGLVLFDLAAGRRLPSPPSPTWSEGATLGFSGSRLAFGTDDSLAIARPGGVTIWDTTRARVARRLAGLEHVCAPDEMGDLASGGSEATGRVVATCLAQSTGRSGPTNFAAARVAVAWDLSSHSTTPAWTVTQPKRDPEFSDEPVLNSDGSSLALLNSDAVGRPSELRILDARTGHQRSLSTLAGYSSVAFAPNNRSLAATEVPVFAVAIVDPSSGAERKVLTGRSASSTSAGGINGVFSPDGQFVAVPTGPGVSLWDVGTGDYLGELDGRDPATTLADPFIASASFSSDGHQLIALDGNQAVIRWNLDTNDLIRAACGIAGRDLTSEEWNSFVGSGVPYQHTCIEGG